MLYEDLRAAVDEMRPAGVVVYPKGGVLLWTGVDAAEPKAVLDSQEAGYHVVFMRELHDRYEEEFV